MKMVLIGAMLCSIGLIIMVTLHSPIGSIPFTVPGGFLIGFGLRRIETAKDRRNDQ